LARTIHIYIRCMYGNFGREIIKYTVMYGAYVRFWPTLSMGKYVQLVIQYELIKCLCV